MFCNLNSEQKNRILDKRAGKFGKVFELKHRRDKEILYCNMCQCDVSSSIIQHERGKRHTLNLEQFVDVEERQIEDMTEKNDIVEIQDTLDHFTSGPLLGLEYLLELQEPQTEPIYICILCDKKGDHRIVLIHLTCYNHIGLYLRRHFPTCYNALAPYKQYRTNWQRALQKLATAIEKKFGRLKPFPIEKHKFEGDRNHYGQFIYNGKHFSETPDCTFMEVIHTELNNCHLVEQLTKRTDLNAENDTHHATNSENPSKRSSFSSVPSISNQKTPLSEKGRLSPTPKSSLNKDQGQMTWINPNYLKNKNNLTNIKDENENEKMRKVGQFRKLARAIEDCMQRILKQHIQNPENHPQYTTEWQRYWNHRCIELRGYGIDVSTYNFKPEWSVFWNKRIIELHSNELYRKKDELRRKLDLQEEPGLMTFIHEVPPTRTNTNQSTPSLSVATQHSQDDEVIIIDDEENVKSHNHSHSDRKRKSPPNTRATERRSRSSSRSRKRFRSKERSPRREENGHKRRRSPRKEEKGLDRERSQRLSDKPSTTKIIRSRSRSHSRGRSQKGRDSEKKKSDHKEGPSEKHKGEEKVGSAADLPQKTENASKQNEDYEPSHSRWDVTTKPGIIQEHVIPVMPDDDETDVNIISVLRLLTALEEHLGSLGPKIIDLLGQALAIEKKEKNSSDTLLDNEINCVLLETAKEKLTGQLLVGLVNIVQERAFKKVIKKTDALIHVASKRKKQKESFTSKITVPGVETEDDDKGVVTKQIATALMMQAKTELKRLSNPEVDMAETSKDSSKPMTTGTFLQQLIAEYTSVQFNEQQEEEEIPVEKIIIPTMYKKTKATKLEKSSEPLSSSLSKSSPTNVKSLSDPVLQTLLRNFKDLSDEEQHNLVTYLKKLEVHESKRVEKLWDFVNLDSKLRQKPGHGKSYNEKEHKSVSKQKSSFSSKTYGGNLDNVPKDRDVSNNKPEEKREKRKPVKLVFKNVRDQDVQRSRSIGQSDRIIGLEWSTSMPEESSRGPTDVDYRSLEGLNTYKMGSFTRDIFLNRRVSPPRNISPVRDVDPVRGIDSLRNIAPSFGLRKEANSSRSSLGSRYQSPTQYPRNLTSYDSNYGSTHSQLQQSMTYPHDMPQTDSFQRRRFEYDIYRTGDSISEQFNSGRLGGNYDRK